MNVRTLRHDARRIFTAAVESVQPERVLGRRAVREVLRTSVDAAKRVVVMALGKAAAPMLQAVGPEVLEQVDDGLLVVPDGYGIVDRPRWLPHRIELASGGHPHPTMGSIDSGARAIRLLDGLTSHDLLVVLLSGGGSAMMDAYAHGIDLSAAILVNRAMLASGADISEINCIRKHISEVKGGRLAAMAFPARTIVFAISDVPGDDPGVIASGPFTADQTTFSDVLEIVDRRSIDLPTSVRTHLELGARGEAQESVKPGDVRLDRVDYHVVASNSVAIDAAADAARSLGYHVVLASQFSGEASDAGRSFAETLRSVDPRTCLIAGGETTVTLSENPGVGGRNQEFGLAAAVHLDDAWDWCVLAGGTDGIDGVTDSAGAIIDAAEWHTECHSLDEAADALRGHDSQPFLKARRMLLITGPTGTNVMDIAIGLRG